MADSDCDREDSRDSDYKNDSNHEEDSKPSNLFRNDGSFLEMFKKMQEQNKDQGKKTGEKRKSDEITSGSSGSSDSKKPLSFVGKRRGGRTLPTGMVKKTRKDLPELPTEPKNLQGSKKTDAWSQYMNEVRKYREQSCEEEGKRRPLVK